MNAVKKIFSIESFVDVILIVFCVSSIATVSDYLIAIHINETTAYAFGAGIGLVLVAMSILLSRVDSSDKVAFNTILVVTFAIALFSGYLQMSAYKLITGELFPSIIKGFSMPIICEAALAYSVSLYTTYRKRKDIAEAEEKFEEGLATIQRESTMDIDPEEIKKEAADKMRMIISARINHFTDAQLAKYGVVQQAAHSNVQSTEQSSEQIQDLKTQISELVKLFEQTKTEHTLAVEKMNTKNSRVKPDMKLNTKTEQSDVNLNTKTEQSDVKLNAKTEQSGVNLNTKTEQSDGDTVQKMNKDEKVDLLAKHLVEHYHGLNTTELNKTKLSDELQMDRVSVGRYLNTLKTNGRLKSRVNKKTLLYQ